MTTFNVLGLNCGTSVDAIDVAHCRFTTIESSGDVKLELLSFTEIPVDTSLRKEVLRLCRPNQKEASTCMAEVCDLNFALGREFTRAIQASGVDLEQVDLIASHGQTLWHQPLGDNRSTLQMAEPAVISNAFKKTVISGFRVAELAAGRQGAPLSGFFENALLADDKKTRISQNIGGIGNATVLPATSFRKDASGSGSAYMAFDTGPGNIFIDAAMRILTDGQQHYDKDGEMGAKGEAEIDANFIEEYLATEPYFQVKPPKTTGRELFSDDVARSLVEKLKAANLSPDGIIATLTRITAESIAQAYEKYVMPNLNGGNLDEIYICGGGAYNPNILKHLQHRLPKSKVMTFDKSPAKIAPGAKEAVLFALLGFLSILGRRIPLPADAESLEPAILGVITPGDNYHSVMKRSVQDPDFEKRAVLERIIS